MYDVERQEKYTFLPTDNYEGVREIYTSLGMTVEATSSLEEGQRIFALGIHCQDGGTCGIASGIYHSSKKRFQILGIYIRREDRKKELVRAALGELLNRVRGQFHPGSYEWIYRQKDEVSDLHLSLLRGLDLPWLSSAVRRRVGIVIKLDTAILRDAGMKLKHNRPYLSSEHMASMGYSFLPWRNCGEEIKGKIRTLLASPEENTEGLSPFLVDKYDPATSFVLTHDSSVCGWVICTKDDAGGVEIRRWYITSAARRNLAGQFLGAYMLRVIQERYKSVYFAVLEHSKSMQRFAKGYLGCAIVEETPLYRLEMEETV